MQGFVHARQACTTISYSSPQGHLSTAVPVSLHQHLSSRRDMKGDFSALTSSLFPVLYGPSTEWAV